MRHSKLANILTKAGNVLDRWSRRSVGKCGSPMLCIPRDHYDPRVEVSTAVTR
jgi:hypothetical protein